METVLADFRVQKEEKIVGAFRKKKRIRRFKNQQKKLVNDVRKN